MLDEMKDTKGEQTLDNLADSGKAINLENGLLPFFGFELEMKKTKSVVVGGQASGTR